MDLSQHTPSPFPARQATGPAKLFVETTTRCNMACAMCVKQSPLSHIPEQDLGLDAFHALAPVLESCTTLILNGIGEPLLHPDLAAMAAFAREHMPQNSRIGFQTNGLLLTEDLAEELITAGVNTVCLSVDALGVDCAREVHGGRHLGRLEQAMALLRNAAQRSGLPLRLGVELVLMADTVSQLPDTLRWAGEHGADFALATHLLPHTPDLLDQSLFNPNTPGAEALFTKWRKRAQEKNLDVADNLTGYFRAVRSPEQDALKLLVRDMREEARRNGVWLHLERLLQWADHDQAELREVFRRAEETARDLGMELHLPPLQAKDTRRCDFVEDRAMFVAASGEVRPCHFLWHEYSCYMDGQAKRVLPVSFGNIHSSDQDGLAIWNSPEYANFREQVLAYDYPYCSNCSYVPCDDVSGETLPFEYDCLGQTVPCGHCMWCMGGLACLS